MNKSGPLHQRRILVVEDEYLIASDLAEAIVQAGGTALGPCANVEAAQRILRSAPDAPDGAILDLNLRGASVVAFAKELDARGVKLIYHTGYETTPEEEGLPVGLMTIKPMRRDDLMDAVCRVLGPSQSNG